MRILTLSFRDLKPKVVFNIVLVFFKNIFLAKYLKSRGNDLATVRTSTFYVAMLSNNSSSNRGNNILGKR